MGALLVCLTAAVGSAEAGADLVGARDLTDLSLEDLAKIEIPLVSTASKFEQETTRAPSSVTVIAAEEIKRYGHRTLADVLNSAPGLYVTYDRNYYYLGVRGFNRPGDYGTRTLVLVDGHRINDNVYYGSLIGSEFILDVDLIDHVEIIRGPGSSLYGSGAFFGVINVVTKTGRALDGGELAAAYASFDTYQGRFSYGKRLQNEVELLFSGTIFDSRGQKNIYYPEYDAPASNNGLAHWVDDERSQSFLASASYKDFTLQGAFVSREKGVPTGAYETVFNDPRSQTRDQRGYVDLRFAHNYNEVLELTARLYADVYKYRGYYPTDLAPAGAPPAVAVNEDYSWGQWWGGEAQADYKLFDRHTITVGGEFRDHLRQDQRNYYALPPLELLDDRRSSLEGGIFGQAEMAILTNLTLNAGARCDFYETFGSTVNPRLALIYNPVPTTALKLIYGTAFRAPNVYELYYADGVSCKANPALQPETIDTYEAVWEQNLSEHARVCLSGYHYRVEDLITLETDPADGLDVFVNRDRTRTTGLEGALEVTLTGGITGRASYALQETKDVATGARLSNSPEHLGKLNVSVPVIRHKLYASLELQASSPRRTLLGRSTDAYAVVNFTLFSRNLLKNLEAAASVYNLFDTRYGDPGGPEHLQDVLPRDGRTFRIKLTYRF